MAVNKILADVTITQLDADLVNYIKNKNYESPQLSDEQFLQESYTDLGINVYSLTLTTLNRLLDYIRTQFGQYWLQELILNTNNISSEFEKFNSKARTEMFDWFKWQPSNKVTLTITIPDKDRIIEKDAWPKVKEFVASSRKTQIIKELLAGAELLNEQGYSRSALTEAVTALECAVNDYAKFSKNNPSLGAILSDRIGVETLEKQINHMGLTGTVNFLFPVIFDENQMPKELLGLCQEAILQRQNVVHNGMRQVRKENLSQYLSSIRKMCKILEDFSIPSS